MEIKVEDGIGWSATIARLERLPPGRSLSIEFESGRRLCVVHQRNGAIRAQIDGGNWIRPNAMTDLTGILRRGMMLRPRS